MSTATSPAVAAGRRLGEPVTQADRQAWWRLFTLDNRYLAPLLITLILIVGQLTVHILEELPSPLLSRLTGGWITVYSPTYVAIIATILIELVAGRLLVGRWPILASAYISGISIGLLLKSQVLWPYLMAAALSIGSKYVLRLGGRHLWNPTNFGISVLLFCAGADVHTLGAEFDNRGYANLLVWFFGLLILYRLGKLHITLTFVAAFIALTPLRAAFTHNSFWTEVGPLTSPMYQLYIFFMITDPKTTTKRVWSQCLVAVLLAVADAILRVWLGEVHALLYALFLVGPTANVIEILAMRKPAVPRLAAA
jgi:hypothetical protein